jgi:hypothetical protein
MPMNQGDIQKLGDAATIKGRLVSKERFELLARLLAQCVGKSP